MHPLSFCSHLKTTFERENIATFEREKIATFDKTAIMSTKKLYCPEMNIVNSTFYNMSPLQGLIESAFIIPLALFINIYFRKSFNFAQNLTQLCFCLAIFGMGISETVVNFFGQEICK